MIPSGVFAVGLWAAYFFVGVAALYLITVLVREWRAGKLW